MLPCGLGSKNLSHNLIAKGVFSSDYIKKKIFLWFTLFILAIVLSLVFLGLGGLFSKLYLVTRDAITPLECGFNSLSDSRAFISLRFFIFAVIFVIFDVELVIVLPILVSRTHYLETTNLYSIYAFLLCLGLYLE